MTYRVDSQEPSGTHVSSKATKEGETIDQEPVRKATSRTRHSFYLDTAVVRSLDHTYKKTYHELYPREMSKSDFLEACLRYALSDLDTIKYNLNQEESVMCKRWIFRISTQSRDLFDPSFTTSSA